MTKANVMTLHCSRDFIAVIKTKLLFYSWRKMKSSFSSFFPFFVPSALLLLLFLARAAPPAGRHLRFPRWTPDKHQLYLQCVKKNQNKTNKKNQAAEQVLLSWRNKPFRSLQHIRNRISASFFFYVKTLPVLKTLCSLIISELFWRSRHLVQRSNCEARWD